MSWLVKYGIMIKSQALGDYRSLHYSHCLPLDPVTLVIVRVHGIQGCGLIARGLVSFGVGLERGGEDDVISRGFLSRERFVFGPVGIWLAIVVTRITSLRLDHRRATETGIVRQEKELERGKAKVRTDVFALPSHCHGRQARIRGAPINSSIHEPFVIRDAVCVYFLLCPHLLVSFIFNLILISARSFTLYEIFCSTCNLYTPSLFLSLQ